MGLVTNRCKKHGNAYPEKECPYCTRENFEKQVADSKEFFRMFGRMILVAPLNSEVTVRVEDVFQHFRIRILEEINPVLQRMKKENES